MFADAVLAARIDRAEGRLLASLAEAGRRRRAQSRALILPFAGGLAVYAAPDSPANKLIGIGFDGPIDTEELSLIEDEWRERGEAPRVELSTLADARIPEALSERGYAVHGFEHVLGSSLATRPATPLRADAALPAEVEVELLRASDETQWIDINMASFASPDGTGSPTEESLPAAELYETILDYLQTPGLTHYLARLDGQPVGAASLRLDGNVAWLAGADTVPTARGQGVHKALIHHRLTDARAAGAEIAVVSTAPGSRSQQNLMRRGFGLLYTRVIFAAWRTSAANTVIRGRPRRSQLAHPTGRA